MNENLATRIKVGDWTVTRAGQGSISLVQKSNTGLPTSAGRASCVQDQHIMDFVAFIFVFVFLFAYRFMIFFHLEYNFILFSWFPVFMDFVDVLGFCLFFWERT